MGSQWAKMASKLGLATSLEEIPLSSTSFHFTMRRGCVKILTMMHECPKCKFVQPQDRYCANCGLDIENYKPVPPTMLQKLGKNTGLHIALVVGLVVALATFIFISQKELIEKHLVSAPQILEVLDKNDADEISNQFSDNENVSEENLNSNEASAEVATRKAAPAAASLATQSTTAGKREIHITFAEAANTLLQQLASEGQILNESAQRRSFLHANISSISALKERHSEFHVLAGGETSPLTANTPIQLDFTHINGPDNDDVGLNLEITPLTISDPVELTVTGQLNLKDEDGGIVTSQEISANYSFSSNSTLLMVGFLPRQSIRQDDLAGFSNTPLAIFESLQFVNGLTDFVIFIQIK